jgi:hypothetical protein
MDNPGTQAILGIIQGHKQYWAQDTKGRQSKQKKTKTQKTKKMKNTTWTRPKNRV